MKVSLTDTERRIGRRERLPRFGPQRRVRWRFCVLMALHRVGMDGESLVEQIWPELRTGYLTFDEMFSHQGGYAALHEKVSIWDREAVITSLEKQDPLWGGGETWLSSKDNRIFGR